MLLKGAVILSFAAVGNMPADSWLMGCQQLKGGAIAHYCHEV